ncbi:dolichyl-phosphate-mannose-protein mannosyltransferase [Hamiltosporidium magnivora]|uniref:Dolichyl-phosphate-mannose--protein mannosyltransferase n=2 Tax=Hamiltosporidium TaxID=1176354 RepID=A0A4Q9L284_9MICR|nr:dolichyl-phosphate-mannose-protein mannosyltransferase [Hamiltosporidium magnivora]
MKLFGTKKISERKLFRILVWLSITTRFFFITFPFSLIQEEAYFIKLARGLIERQFKYDLQPPLGKLIISFLLFWGKSNFSVLSEIGMPTVFHKASYVLLRGVSVILSIFVILMTYKILLRILEPWKAFLVSLLVLFENLYQMHFKFITADPYSLFFMVCSFYFFSEFYYERKYVYLFLVGIFCGLNISSKLIGISFWSAVSIYILVEIFTAFYNPDIKFRSIFVYFMNFVFGMIVVPFLIYIASFYIYFLFQTEFTNEARNLSLHFQSDLKNFPIEQVDKYVMDHSILTLINTENKVYLNSSDEYLTTGSKQQIVSGDQNKDEYALWRIMKVQNIGESNQEPNNEGIDSKFIKNGDSVKIIHLMTDKYLHSHEINTENSKDKKFFEATAYGSGSKNMTDENDYWVVECDTEFLQCRTSLLQLKHHMTHSYLGIRKLENNTYEAHTSRDGRKGMRNFYIEDNRNEEIHKISKDIKSKEKIENYKNLTFFQKFIELNSKIFKQTNNLDNKNISTISPWKWLFSIKGSIHYFLKTENYSLDMTNNNKNVLIVPYNILTHVFSSIIAILFPIFLFFNHISLQRYRKGIFINFFIIFIYISYLFNYLPFIFTSSQFYQTNYLFSLYFSLLLIGISISIFGENLLLIFVISTSFVFFNNLNVNGTIISYEECLRQEICSAV